jgi:hypothetical protein
VNFNNINVYEVEIEHIGESKALTAEDMHFVKKIYSLINPQYVTEMAYQGEIYDVAKHIIHDDTLYRFKNDFRLKQLANQVISLTKNVYYNDVYPPDGYYLTIKADGIRCIVSINGPRCRIITSKLTEFTLESNESVTILDAEIIYRGVSNNNDKPGADSSKFDIWIFDCMVWKGENLTRSGFTNRLIHLEDAAKLVNDFVSKDGNSAKAKKFVHLEGEKLEHGFREIYDEQYPFSIDGLIITEPDKNYRDTKNYKWKPLSHMTIDFLAVKCPPQMLGILPYAVIPGKDLYLLFVGISQDMHNKLGLSFLQNYKIMFPEYLHANYYPIQFSPSINPTAYLYYHDPAIGNIDRMIIELKRDESGEKWEFVRRREDRMAEKNYFGNDYKVAEMTYINYTDKFDLDDLWNPKVGYFTKQASDIYAAPNRYKRFVISNLIMNNLNGAKWVIDEASGRGADLHRYQEVGVENALFIDEDTTAIAELIRRKFEYFAIKKRRMREWVEGAKIKETPRALTIHTLVTDLKSPSVETIKKIGNYNIGPGTVDGIICNFAIHYFCDSIENIRNLLTLNSKLLKVGGVFIFTAMDGGKIFDLLRGVKTGDEWSSKQDDIKKYAIKKLYSGDKLSKAGQNISVLMPFSDEMYEEPLAPIDSIISEAAKLGFNVELDDSFLSLISNFQRADRSLFDKLTEEDKTYINLHRFVSLRKVKNISGGR